MSHSMYPDPRHRIYSTGQSALLTIVVLLILLGSGLLFFSAVNRQIAASSSRSTTAGASTPVSTQAFTGRDPYPPYTGNPVFNDLLNTNSQGRGWDVFSRRVNNNPLNCRFAGGAYESTDYYASNDIYGSNVCFAEKTDFSNFTFQVQAILVQGLCAGIVFRANSKANDFDRFLICSNDWFDYRQCSHGFCDVVFANGPTPVINSEAGQSNLLAVVANGNAITIYVNGKQIASTQDNSFSHGQIGFATSGYNGTLTVARFRNAEMWTM